MEHHQPLRESLFHSVPPFINYVPSSQLPYDLSPGPQYWDQSGWDQGYFWRIPLAMAKWIEQRVQFEARTPTMPLTSAMVSRQRRRRSAILSLLVEDPFNQRSDDAIVFQEAHNGTKLVMFPSGEQLSRKDQLADNMKAMRQAFPDDFNFHPRTFVWPRDQLAIAKAFLQGQGCWMLKPPCKNNGKGVKVIPNDIQELTRTTHKGTFCIQEYVYRPFLIRGLKFDLRFYVLLTSLEPLTIYLYNDGLVRVATETYSENANHISNPFIHITNFAVNIQNSESFSHNTDVNGCDGHKWRLQALWPYLQREHGWSQSDISRVWSETEDIIVKSILSGFQSMRQDFRKLAKSSSYNAYKMLGYDVLIDLDRRVHLLEVNTRPALLDDPLDKAVNRPMISEAIRIIGYHIPNTVDKHQHKFKACLGLQQQSSTMMTFNEKIYCKKANIDDELKQRKFMKESEGRAHYLHDILQDLSGSDVRTLIKLEEERSQCRDFARIFPTKESHRFFKFMTDISYYDLLADAFESKYSDNRVEGIDMINSYCKRGVHL